MEYLEVSGWNKWQSYRADRGTPPWIKVYRKLLSSSKWAALNDAEKGQLISLWIVAADREGILPSEPKTLQKICQLDKEPDIQRFIHLGWLAPHLQNDDAKMASSGCQVATEYMTDRKHADTAEIETKLELDIEAEKLSQSEGLVRFGDFWNAYPKGPRKVDRVRCKKVWVLNNLEKIGDDILRSLETWKLSHEWRKESGRYICAPLVWLNQRRWETELSEHLSQPETPLAQTF